MASFWQKTLFYLGLVDEGQAETEAAVAPVEQEATQGQGEVRQVEPRQPGRSRSLPGRRVEPPLSIRRRISADPGLAEAGVYVGEGTNGESAAGSMGEPEIIEARAFSDAQRLADHIRNRTPVVFDLRSTEPEMVRRLVDFASGLTYALDGTLRRVAKGVILVAPHRVTLSRDERQRLAELGLYQVADG